MQKGHNKGEKLCGSNRVAEDIKKWWQEYTEELHKKDFHNSGWDLNPLSFEITHSGLNEAQVFRSYLKKVFSERQSDRK